MEKIVTLTENYKFRLSGEVWIKLGHDLTREKILESPNFHETNLIVDIASDLIASWAIETVSPTIPGILTLAVGTGGVGWDLQNPPAESASQEQLVAELTRKEFSDKTYVDDIGDPTVSRTNVIDLTTTFLESEANGPLVEMGLFGGVDATVASDGTMVNVKNFPVLNKTTAMTMAILWRLTF